MARLALTATVLVIALLLRLRAVEMLPADHDEDNYLRLGQQYASALVSGDWERVLTTRELSEHPALGKLAYGAVLAILPPAPEIPPRPLSAPPDDTLPQPHWLAARLLSAAFGFLTVAALAVFDPLAALLLAVGTWHIKYTSEVMVEAQAALASLVSVLAYLRSRRRSARGLAVSAIALGLAAATKYVYCVAGLAILVDWLWTVRRVRASGAAAGLSAGSALGRPLGSAPYAALAWGCLALAVFFVANPELWPDPLNRLRESLLYHPGYALGKSVQTAAHPPWQPLVWLSQSVPWHRGVFLVTADAFISLLAVLGVRQTWRRQRVFTIWLALGLGFLLVWPTKWPQYVIVLAAPLSVCAANGLRAFVLEPLQRVISRPLASRLHSRPSP